MKGGGSQSCLAVRFFLEKALRKSSLRERGKCGDDLSMGAGRREGEEEREKAKPRSPTPPNLKSNVKMLRFGHKYKPVKLKNMKLKNTKICKSKMKSNLNVIC